MKIYIEIRLGQMGENVSNRTKNINYLCETEFRVSVRIAHAANQVSMRKLKFSYICVSIEQVKWLCGSLFSLSKIIRALNSFSSSFSAPPHIVTDRSRRRRAIYFSLFSSRCARNARLNSGMRTEKERRSRHQNPLIFLELSFTHIREKNTHEFDEKC